MRSCFGKVWGHARKPGIHFLKKSTLEPRFPFKSHSVCNNMIRNFCVFACRHYFLLELLCRSWSNNYYLLDFTHRADVMQDSPWTEWLLWKNGQWWKRWYNTNNTHEIIILQSLVIICSYKMYRQLWFCIDMCITFINQQWVIIISFGGQGVIMSWEFASEPNCGCFKNLLFNI